MPVVLLAGCATALSAPGKSRGEAALPGFARQLLAWGVPAVVAMQAPVSDRYATELGARFYRELAVAETPDPLAALVGARRSIEIDRQRGQLAGPVDLAEWATPSIWLRGPSLPQEIAPDRGRAGQPGGHGELVPSARCARHSAGAP